MRVTEITTGRRFAVAFDDGEDFFTALDDFCRDTGIRAGHIPTLIGGFSRVRLVGTCGPLQHPERPLWDEIEVETLEVLGGGTLAWDSANNRVAPHIHVSASLKAASADGRTSHLLGGTVQFITELVIEEWTTPEVTRPRVPALYDVPLLTFGAAG
ncbi:PPC domain-containing DNA-binding protein [Streptomyces viridosporus]|uniref:DNA-binding protein n=1 Tax=Streptomyces viridosporus T7A TaxID=665577 RepID=A0ABX6A7I0_STRVD|nr:PPC domain-containing DNA-binding protein [Streptomyces viridosporus]QEU83415.1 DNA-binding protein [Streptomyces viridosporus T7A]